jgi:hypothetical protein
MISYSIIGSYWSIAAGDRFFNIALFAATILHLLKIQRPYPFSAWSILEKFISNVPSTLLSIMSWKLSSFATRTL